MSLESLPILWQRATICEETVYFELLHRSSRAEQCDLMLKPPISQPCNDIYFRSFVCRNFTAYANPKQEEIRGHENLAGHSGTRQPVSPSSGVLSTLIFLTIQSKV